jgi:recombinational DNA repair protein RecR
MTLPRGKNALLDSDKADSSILEPSKPVKKKEKEHRHCKICGRSLKQKYYQICIYCRQQRKRQKLIERGIRNIVKKELNHRHGAKPK